MDEKSAVLSFVGAVFPHSLSRPCRSLVDLVDGKLLQEMLCNIAPAHFDAPQPEQPGTTSPSNWALCHASLKKTVRSLDAYFKNHLHKEVINLSTLDVEAIAKPPHDTDEILNLMELVIGAAVMCDEKARFIKAIFALDSTVQNVLKALIEQAMGRLIDYDPSASTSASGSAQHQNEEQHGAAAVISEMQQVVGHLHEERQRLLVDLIDQKSACSAAQAETERLRGQVADLLRDKEAFEGSEQRASTMAASYSEQLKRELDDCKRELDLSVVECNNLRAEIASREQRATASREMQAKLEMENHQLSDELDVARDQAAKLSKAEAQLDKYQHRLEELPNLRKENKDLLERLDQYLDKVQELENANKSASTLGRMVEQYKDRAVEMERQKFEAMSALQMQSAELERLRVEAEDQSEARRFLEEELAQTRQELEQHVGAAAAAAATRARGSTSSFGGAEDGGLSLLGLEAPMETTATLHEKLKIAEREIRALRAGCGVGVGGGGEALPRDASYSDLLQADAAVAVQELAMARAELEDALRAKREREEMLLSLRKVHAEMQLELQRTTKALHDNSSAQALSLSSQAQAQAQAQAATASEKEKVSGKALREVESQLAQANNTIRLLEDRLKEKEGAINKLEQDKDKLEVFSRSTLSAFKEKFLAELGRLKSERAVLEKRLRDGEERRKQSEATSRTEQRLVTAALYELGGKVMDRNIHTSTLSDPSANYNSTNYKSSTSAGKRPSTLLGAQTAAQLRALDSQLMVNSPATPQQSVR